jgi:hypothetical protein
LISLRIDQASDRTGHASTISTHEAASRGGFSRNPNSEHTAFSSSLSLHPFV